MQHVEPSALGRARAGVGLLLLACALAATLVWPAAAPAEIAQRSEADIQARWQQLMPAYSAGPYTKAPSFSAPYLAGTLAPGFMQDGLDAINYARYLAGLPDDVAIDATYTDRAQHGAVLLRASTFSHTPPRPADMDQAFYDLGYQATSSSNIGWGYASLWSFNVGCLSDADAGNIDRVGHRRWLLNPPMAKTGMGFADGRSCTYSFDRSRSATFPYTKIAWPAEGCFPAEMFDPSMPWSLTLNPTIYAWTMGTADHAVTLRRLRDGRTWTFTDTDTDKSGEYFNFDTAGYGVANCFIFRPNPSSVGGYEIGDVFEVTLSGGITRKSDGTPAVVSYSTRFVSQVAGSSAPATPTPSPTTLTFYAPPTAPYRSARLAGRLTDERGAALFGKAVKIEYSYDGQGWAELTTASTTMRDSKGWLYEYIAKPKRRTLYRASFAGDVATAADASPGRGVVPKAYLTRPAFGRDVLTYGKTYPLTGHLKPGHAVGKAARVYAYHYANGHYTYQQSFAAAASDYLDYSRLTASIKLPARGRWRLRTVHLADDENAKSYSEYRYVTVK